MRKWNKILLRIPSKTEIIMWKFENEIIILIKS